MIYREIKTPQELDNLIHQINLFHFGEKSQDFLKKEGRIIYGYFVTDDAVNYNTLIVFGDYLSPTDIKPAPEKSIFAKLKAYGLSSKFRGLIDIRGNVLLQQTFNSINSLIDTRLVGTVKGKSAIICSDGSLMSPIIYDRLYNAGENTIAYEINGKRGFMNSNAEIVIEAEFECVGSNVFHNGYIQVRKNIEGREYEYSIDHYGLMVSEIIDVSDDIEPQSEHNLGTGYYPYGELPDALDAYEGDESNYWNND